MRKFNSLNVISWRNFYGYGADMEYDLYGSQRKVEHAFKNHGKAINEYQPPKI